MRLLIVFALLLAVMAGLVAVILALGTALSKTAGDVAVMDPVRGGLIPKICFAVLWLLIAGTATGLIGGA